VQKLLERLQAKGFVAAGPPGEVRTFAAAVSREELVGRRLRDVADRLCEGSLTALVSNLVRSEPLSRKELRELSDLLDQLKKQSRSKDPRR
jgi:BlaI family transcriptional regulator, penicillinase repressor